MSSSQQWANSVSGRRMSESALTFLSAAGRWGRVMEADPNGMLLYLEERRVSSVPGLYQPVEVV